MTREEAIEILKTYKEESEEDYWVMRAKALGMAISALSVPEGDYISKSAVLAEMEKRHAEGDFITKGFINSLPTFSVPKSDKSMKLSEVYNLLGYDPYSDSFGG